MLLVKEIGATGVFPVVDQSMYFIAGGRQKARFARLTTRYRSVKEGSKESSSLCKNFFQLAWSACAAVKAYFLMSATFFLQVPLEVGDLVKIVTRSSHLHSAMTCAT